MHKGCGKRGNIVVEALLRTQMFRRANGKTFGADAETFFASRTQNLRPQQMLRAWANGET